jgi:uncharacterized protein YjdB
VAPATADQNVTWSTSDNTKVTVADGTDPNVPAGTVKAVAVTTEPVTITANSAADNTVKDTCAVYVTLAPIAVEDVELDIEELDLLVGETETLIATVKPANAHNKAVTWKTSNDKVATVVPTITGGFVTAVGKGTATITVTTASGGKTAECEVTVTTVDVTGVTLNINTLSLNVGRTSLLTATVAPSDATNKKVTWRSSDETKATVTDGVVEAVAAGTATITVTTADGGKTANCTVTVVDMPVIPGMVWIDPGTFMMGSPTTETGHKATGRMNEVQHSVTLTKGFYMGEYPVTLDDLSWTMGGYIGEYYHYPQSDSLYQDQFYEFPVDSITWCVAIIHCNRLSMNKGLTPVYSIYKATAPNPGNPSAWEDIPANWSTNPNDWGQIPWRYDDDLGVRWSRIRWEEGADGYRLPTEAEWEYACRAGTETPYNTGNTITSDDANFGTIEQTVPVGMYAPNAWGLYDMHGNVGEWCWDWLNTYPTTAQTDPKGPEVAHSTFPYRVLRGGSFIHNATGQRSAARGGREPESFVYWDYSEYWDWDVKRYPCGFRVVRNAPNSTPAPKTVINAPGAQSVDAQSVTERLQEKVLPQGIRGKISASELQALRGEAIFRDDRPVGQ